MAGKLIKDLTAASGGELVAGSIVAGSAAAGTEARKFTITQLMSSGGAYTAGGTDVPVADGGTGASTGIAALANLGAVSAIVSGSNVTTTSASAQDITGLSFSIGANETWAVFGLMLTSCDNTGGVKFAVNVPASASLNFQWNGSGTSGTALEMTGVGADDTLSGTALNRVSGSLASHYMGFVANSTNAGTVQMRFAAGTAAQTATIRIGSTMFAIRIS